jgi:hypothetical protein
MNIRRFVTPTLVVLSLASVGSLLAYLLAYARTPGWISVFGLVGTPLFTYVLFKSQPDERQEHIRADVSDAAMWAVGTFSSAVGLIVVGLLLMLPFTKWQGPPEGADYSRWVVAVLAVSGAFTYITLAGQLRRETHRNSVREGLNRGRHVWFNNLNLEQANTEWKASVRCKSCAITWSIQGTEPFAPLNRDWWLCPNGCNTPAAQPAPALWLPRAGGAPPAVISGCDF